jgi:hypothetical protein
MSARVRGCFGIRAVARAALDALCDLFGVRVRSGKPYACGAGAGAGGGGGGGFVGRVVGDGEGGVLWSWSWKFLGGVESERGGGGQEDTRRGGETSGHEQRTKCVRSEV